MFQVKPFRTGVHPHIYVLITSVNNLR